MPGYCKCGAQLGRSGKCPALCEPVPQPAPKYTGPLVVGRTHMSRLAAPVYVPGPAVKRGNRVRFQVPGGVILDGSVTLTGEHGELPMTVVDDRGNHFTPAPADILQVLRA